MSTAFTHADAGAIPALLDRMTTAVPFESIDELWLFPTRRIAGVESTVIVLALYTDQPDRRRVATAHFKATRNKRGEAKVETDLRDHAIAPADRLTRVIDGVLRRLGDDLATTPPKSARISGQEDRWLALVEANASNIEFEEALDRVRVRLRALGREDLVSDQPADAQSDDETGEELVEAVAEGDATPDDSAATTDMQPQEPVAEGEPAPGDSAAESDAAPYEDIGTGAQERTGAEEKNG